MSDPQAPALTLEQRIQRLEDDKAIRELLAQYGFTADQGQGEDYVTLFTEDGVMDLNRTGHPEDFEQETIVRFEGRDQLRAWTEEWKTYPPDKRQCLHFMGNNLRTVIDGDSATAESYNFTLFRRNQEFVLLNAAINRWTLRKADGQWRIVECKRRRPGTEDYDRILMKNGSPG